MKPFTRTIIELFKGERRYLIPLYQRQYAWKVTPQLDLLWGDIRRIAARLHSGGEAQAPHFMGAIVISKISTFGKQVQSFEVIDGQQRLTTLQLLLAALRDVSSALLPEFAEKISPYLFNFDVMETPDIERFKLWPSQVDRPYFLSLVDQSLKGALLTTAKSDGGTAVQRSVAAYEFFRQKIQEHVCPGGKFDALLLEQLFETLRSGLAVVSIELEGGDEAQTIFETLNSRGVDLSSGDLLRNFIFQRAKGMGQSGGLLNIDVLYEKYWLPLDGWFWREEETRGRLTKPRLDWMLVDHLTMRLAKLISADDLFDRYREWILENGPFPSVEAELQSVQSTSKIARRIAEQSVDDPLGRFGKFSKAFDVSTAIPLILYLTTEVDLGVHLPEALTLIESYIVRRDICGLTTANYNRFFAELMIARLRDAPIVDVKTLHEALSASDAATMVFPSDADWQEAWLGHDQYKSSRQPKLRYLFEAIEHRKRADDDELVAIKSDLTLEHIMPQGWHQNWPVPGFDHVPAGELDLERLTRETARAEAVNKLGNLTLLTRKLNSKISNGAFATKMPEVRAQTALTLNRELHNYDFWNEDTILQRGVNLFNTAVKIWPAPVSMASKQGQEPS
ncbi:DUF262 domain-containing protein [Methylobacterium sp. Leaf94]|uniref:DUF262 domain-containing protein n=1 Tax=Methylobacterium sp. Leaf94 TaxID=1736250 RepID=UPI0009E6DA14|nr:DUF262 domain-containing protein [Methylobacterium sp. Leaf94]